MLKGKPLTIEIHRSAKVASPGQSRDLSASALATYPVPMHLKSRKATQFLASLPWTGEALASQASLPSKQLR